MSADTRVMMYRAGESRIFPSPEAVPEGEGWQDSPVPEAEAEAESEPVKPARKSKKTAEAADGDGN